MTLQMDFNLDFVPLRYVNTELFYRMGRDFFLFPRELFSKLDLKVFFVEDQRLFFFESLKLNALFLLITYVEKHNFQTFL